MEFLDLSYNQLSTVENLQVCDGVMKNTSSSFMSVSVSENSENTPKHIQFIMIQNREEQQVLKVEMLEQENA